MSNETHSGARLLLRVVSPVTALAIVTLASGAMAVFTSEEVEAKTPGARYCFSRACHRVMTLAETRAAVGKSKSVITSFYDDCRRDRYNPCGLTSSGEAYRPGEANSAASPILPDGTVVLVRNPRNGQSAIVRINNAGPYWGNRTLDLSRAAGVKLGLASAGVARVEVIVLRAPTASEARYRKGRVYPRLPGSVGAFASLGEAQVYAALKLDLPDAISDDMIAVAHADPQVTPVSPVGFEPLTGTPPKRRLPADAIRAASLQPAILQPALMNPSTAQAAYSPAATPSLVVHATEISGASPLPPQAGAMSRAINERASIIGSLRAGDFDRRGKSLLEVAAPASGGEDVAAMNETARLAAASAEDDAQGCATGQMLELISPFATRGERGWHRRATATVTNIVSFAPASVSTPETRIAQWAAVSRLTSLDLQFDGTNDRARKVASAIILSLSGHDRFRRAARGPARARSNEFGTLAA